MVGAVTQAGSNIISALGNALSSGISTVSQAGNSIVSALGTALSQGISNISNIATSISTAISSKITSKAIDGLVSSLTQLNGIRINDIRINVDTASATEAVNSLKTELNSIPTSITITVSIQVDNSALSNLTSQLSSISSSFGSFGFGFHAKGGIVPHATGSIISRPTITQYRGQTHLFGEAGREAILPLDSYTGWMDEVADRVEDRINKNDDKNENLMQLWKDLIPVINKIAADTERTADKDSRPVVKIGNRDIRTAYDTQVKADGYSFTR